MRLIKPDEWTSFYSDLRGYHDAIATRTEYDMGYTDALDWVDDWMDAQPAVDAVEVVRCKDCKSSDYSGCSDGMVYCMEHSCYMDENGYCSDGEREI